MVSIIVTTKNSEDTLEKCLESIASQNYSQLEIVVVDNNSDDSTKSIAYKYTKKVFDKGPERSMQRNFGARKAKGKYFLFIDSDMELSKNVVALCVKQLKDTPYVKGIVIPEESFGEGFWAACKKLERSFYVGEVGVSWLEGARFFPRLTFEELGGYDEENTGTEDYDLSQRVKDKYGEMSVQRVATFIYHNEGELSLTKTLKKKYYYAQKLGIYKKKNSRYFIYQSNIFNRYKIFFSNPRRLFKNPILGVGMLFMKTCEFIAMGFGYLASLIKIS